jgi:hypothetical protein
MSRRKTGRSGFRRDAFDLDSARWIKKHRD